MESGRPRLILIDEDTSSVIVDEDVTCYELYIKVEGGDNLAEISYKGHRLSLFSRLLALTEKAQYIAPQTLK